MPLNPRLRERIAAADLIIYAPGTQHSSLFPSYLTKDLSRAIASNLTAIKLLVTNIQADAEISGSTAVDIVERAVYYLKEKGKLPLPVPTLITHYIINDPKILESDADAGYVPLGHLETLEDPRLVRIGHYEDGVSGRHDASKVLTPFLAVVSVAAAPPAHRGVAVRRGIAQQAEPVGARDASRRHSGSRGRRHRLLHRRRRSRRRVHAAAADRAAESAGWIRVAPAGRSCKRSSSASSTTRRSSSPRACIAAKISSACIPPLMSGRLDAVWGSRRLSLKDIEASYRLRYNHKALLGSFSYLGSHVLSAAYLVAVRAICLRHAVGRAGGARRLSDEPAGAARRQARQSVSACARFSARRPIFSKRRSSSCRCRPNGSAGRRSAEGLRSLAVIAWQRMTRPEARPRPQRHRPTCSPERRRAGRVPSRLTVRSPDTVLIIPAAGAGTRLQSTTPKVLSPSTAGR